MKAMRAPLVFHGAVAAWREFHFSLAIGATVVLRISEKVGNAAKKPLDKLPQTCDGWIYAHDAAFDSLAWLP